MSVSAIVRDMKKKYYSKFQIKDKVLRRELVRAHGMIVLLVLALLTTLAMLNMYSSNSNAVLVSVEAILLAVVGFISLSVIVSILAKRKK